MKRENETVTAWAIRKIKEEAVAGKELEIQNLYEALKSAAYYIEHLENVQKGKKVRDLGEAQSSYQHSALALIKAYEQEINCEARSQELP